jgi:RNA polymerase sigma-70 factor (ECF subfamily)
LNGIDRFEGRSSLKWWILRILANTAMKRGGREARTVPMSSLGPADASGPTVEPDRFRPARQAFPGHWQVYPGDWSAQPDDKLLAVETLEVVKRVVDDLPATQRRVITMRDVVGFSAAEVCRALDLSAANQRVLLHRARSQVRAALEAHLDE